jgi:hypothetical protein
MKPTLVFGMCLSLSLTLVAQANLPGSSKIVEGYGKRPLAFEANQGQTDPQVKYLSRGAGYSLFLTSHEAVLALHEASRQEPALSGLKARTSPGKGSRESKSAVLRLKLVGSNAKTEVTGQDELPGKSNYFIGNDPKKWHTKVRQFAKVRYENVYPGVDLVYYGHQRELEYDFVVQPGASPKAIRLGIEGARLRLEHGDLVMTSAAGDVHLRSAHIYQELNGVRRDVRGRYVIKGKGEVGFEVAAYDRRRALVIDPVLAYSTFLGGSGGDGGAGIAVDSAGNVYVTGVTGSTDFPTVGAVQPANNGVLDCFVTKFNTDGSALVYSTYLGGSGYDSVGGIALDSAGSAYLAGYTESTDFPTVHAIQPGYAGNGDAFVAKINAAGSAVVYSTYLGGSGSDGGDGIAVDSVGRVYVTGQTGSTDFPTVNALQPTYVGIGDAFVTKINAAGTALVYSTYLGGSETENSFGIAVDSAGNVYVIGDTGSDDFPVANAIQPTPNGNGDAFVTKINAAGSAFVYSTYLGGSGGERGSGIATDSAGNAYVIGTTQSTDFPTKNPIQPTNGGDVDAFVTEINAVGSAVVFSTYLGGTGAEWGHGVAVDPAGNVYVTGITGSTDFPLVNAIQSAYAGNSDAFVAKITAGGGALAYSTYLGGRSGDIGLGIAADANGTAYVTGTTSSVSGKKFPATVFAFQQSPKGRSEAFVSKIASETFVNISPQKLGFSMHVLGTTSAAKKLKVTNNGGMLTINKIFIGGLDPDDFAQSNNCGNSIAAGASCTISVTFRPTVKNQRRAELGISGSDPASPQAIPLSGTGTVVSLSETTLSFGDQPVGTTSASQSVTLKNLGSTQLNFTGISITGTNAGDFSEANSCGTSIAGGASCTIMVTFKPTAIGTRGAAVSISDDGGGSPQRVHLTGTGT